MIESMRQSKEAAMTQVEVIVRSLLCPPPSGGSTDETNDLVLTMVDGAGADDDGVGVPSADGAADDDEVDAPSADGAGADDDEVGAPRTDNDGVGAPSVDDDEVGAPRTDNDGAGAPSADDDGTVGG